MANTQQGEPMLEKCFFAPKTLRRLRDGISGPHIDAFADDLERDGYAPASAVRYIRAAAHLGCFVQRKGEGLDWRADSERIRSGKFRTQRGDDGRASLRTERDS